MNNRIFNNKVSFVPIDQLAGPIYFGWSVSPFGQCFTLIQSNTLIGIAFKNNQTKEQIENTMKARWLKNNATLKPLNTDKTVETIFFKNRPIQISFIGSPLQAKVWNALLEIPVGETTTYSYIAKKLDNTKAVRAVATAIGQNPIAWFIPCHRIIRKSGGLGGYRWGLEIKKMMLSHEIKI